MSPELQFASFEFFHTEIHVYCITYNIFLKTIITLNTDIQVQDQLHHTVLENLK